MKQGLNQALACSIIAHGMELQAMALSCLGRDLTKWRTPCLSPLISESAASFSDPSQKLSKKWGKKLTCRQAVGVEPKLLLDKT